MARKRDLYETETSKRLQREFGRRLQEVRKAKGLPQDTFARQLGLTRTSVSNIEQGRQRVFLDQVYRMAHRLGVEVEELLPPAEGIFDEPSIRTASDDPLAADVAMAASQVIREVLGNLSNAPRPIDPSTDKGDV